MMGCARGQANCLKEKVALRFTILLLFIIAYILQRQLLDNYFYWDAHWALSCADQLLHGKKYYYDFFETNPPLIILFCIPFVLVGNLLSIAPILVMQAFFFVLILLFLVLNLKLLKNIFQNDSGMIYFTLLMFALVELLFPMDAFTDKEHLILIVFVPYFLLLTQRCQRISLQNEYMTEVDAAYNGAENSSAQRLSINSWLAAFIGFFVGLGVAIKPYFILAVIFCEIYYGLKCQIKTKGKIFKIAESMSSSATRKTVARGLSCVFRPEINVMLIFGLVYIISIFIFFPVFFSRVLPLVTKLYVPFFSTLPFGKLIQGLPVLVLSACFLSFSYRYRKYNDYFWLLRLITLGFLGAFFMAKQNWYYHLYAAFAMSFVLLSSVVFLNTRSLIGGYKGNEWTVNNCTANNSSKNLIGRKLAKMSLIFLSAVILLLELGFVTKQSLQYALSPTFSTILAAPIKYCNAIRDFSEKNSDNRYTKNAGTKNVLVLSTSFHTVEIPLLCHHAISSNRFPHMALLPGVVQLKINHQPVESAKYKKILFTMLNNDIQKNPPTLIVIDNRGYRLLVNHHRVKAPFLPFLLSDHTFKKFLSQYYLAKKTRYFSLYVRN